MEALNSKIETIYNQLKRTDVVTHKNVTDLSISIFSRILNKVIPLTEHDRNFVNFVRFFYKRYKHQFFNFITQSNLLHLTLLTEGSQIISVLDLKGIIMIRWDNNNKEFIVTNNNENQDKMKSQSFDAESAKPRQRGKRGGRIIREKNERKLRSKSLDSSNLDGKNEIHLTNLITKIYDNEKQNSEKENVIENKIEPKFRTCRLSLETIYDDAITSWADACIENDTD